MQLWTSRFTGRMNPYAWVYNESLSFDHVMAQEDIENSISWATGLMAAKVISADEFALIAQGLTRISDAFENGTFVYKEGDEDIHTAVERALTDMIGPLAGKLHTGRSRNDQVASDIRSWLAKRLPKVVNAILDFQQVLLNKSVEWQDVILPGYTHLQRAQPVLLGHQLMSHFWSLERDKQRFLANLEHTLVSPLGCGALAGTAFPIDRELVAAVMGYDKVAQNSLDAVSDRDFLAEFQFNCSLLLLHLAKLSEMVILYASSEFGFLILDDAFSTGSSLMPQKKNPDIFELVRGKSAAGIGNLTNLLTLLKALPSAYDKDLQDDKKLTFATYDLVIQTLEVLEGTVDTLTAATDKTTAAVDSYMFATDVADFLVKKGIPFRQAHHIAGQAVAKAIAAKKGIDQLTVEEWQVIYPQFEVAMLSTINAEYSVNQRNAIGGTGKKAFKNQIKAAKEALAA